MEYGQSPIELKKTIEIAYPFAVSSISHRALSSMIMKQRSDKEAKGGAAEL